MTTAKAPRLVLAALSATLIGLITAVPTRAEEPTAPTVSGVVLRLADTASIDDAIAGHPVQVERLLLASRGIYLLEVTDPGIRADPKKTAELAKRMARAPGVEYAEANSPALFADSHYHSWPDGQPVDAGTDPTQWQTQPVTGYLNLAAAHQISTGAGSVVAVLDTGADATHPALAGHLMAGYDYIDDDPDPADDAQNLDSNQNGIPDEAHGHGTFVAGTVALVAPGARILPMRVLDSDGAGNVFVLAEAITDAVDAGADVINLSLGTSAKDDSKLLQDVIKHAQQRGVVVIAAAGNAGSKDREYPAQDNEVLAVASSSADGQTLSEFSNWGQWVSVAAPAEHIFGPMPGGRYSWWAGTSVAAPQVSGQVALLQARGIEAKELAKAVTKNTHKLDSKNDGRKIKNGSIDLLASLTRSKIK